MEFKPGLPEQNVNVSTVHPLIELFVLLAGVAILLSVLYWAMGFLIDFAVDHLSPEAEAVLFSTFADLENEDKEGDTHRNKLIQNIVDELGQCVAINYAIKSYIIKSDQSNAFALPGGKIVIFSGLLENINSENGLAFVLAHELGHFKNRDHLRAMGRSIVLIALSTIITGDNSALSNMLVSATGFGQAQYSQARESMADETALRALNCLYGHVGGATEFFEGARSDENNLDLGILHYFSTHPELEKRIKDIKRMSKDMGYFTDRVRQFQY